MRLFLGFLYNSVPKYFDELLKYGRISNNKKRFIMCPAKKVTAQQIYDLFSKEASKNSVGNIKIKLFNVSTIIKDKSLVGYAIQEWFGEWLKSENIYFRSNPNTQMPPDFYLDETNTTNLLELKTFDADAGANFDIANFEAFCRDLKANAYRLDEDYLIISYTLVDGELKIKKVWLKKVWEITCPSKEYPIKTQNKQKIIYNIRPAAWDSKNSKFKTFATKQEFVKALYETLLKYKKTSADSKDWLQEVSKNYKLHTKKDLF